MFKNFITLLFFSLYTSILVAQNVQLNGVISDENGDALIGVNVIEKNTSNGSITDLDGSFTLTTQSDSPVLIFSYLGYETKEIVVGDQQQFNIQLLPDSEELDEVVVIGYGVQKKKVVTGAISKVKAEDLEKLPVVRIENSLQGQTSGVRVTSTSGQPGAGSAVRIRGTTTINFGQGGNDPLYVVDGIPIEGGIDFLSQGDIESIEVLKDAASASIYGTRAAAGVVLVTTKSGTKDKLEVSYHGYYGTQAPWKKLALLNSTEYATLMNEMAVSSGQPLLYEDPQSLGVGTDWQDAVFRTDAPMMNHDLSLSAGSATSKYFASFSFFDQDGIVSQDRSNYKRFTARFNSDHKISKYVKFGNTLAYTRVKATGVSTNSEFGSPLNRAINMDPVTPLLETDPDVLGSIVFENFPVVTNDEGIPYGISNNVGSEILNPVAALAVEQGWGWSDKIVSSVFGEVNFLKDFTFKSSIGTDLAFWGGEGFAPVYYLNAANRNDINSYNRSQNRGLRWIFQNTLSYKKQFNQHNIEAFVGTSAEKNKGQGIGGSVPDLPVDNIEDASFGFPVAAEDQRFFGFEYLQTISSLFGRLNYNFGEKYLLSLAMRRDGSSKFGSNNKYGYFPSVSVGWVVSEEDFINTNNNLNFLKLRGSYGVNGSDRISDFLYVSTVGGARNYTFGANESLTNGVSPNRIANPDLRWEETSQLNFGFDAKLFKQFSLTVDLFDKQTKGMLLDVDVPGYVGNAGPVANIASMSNRGIEVELGYNTNISDLKINLNGNVTYLENEVIDIGREKEFLLGQSFGTQGLQITRKVVGLPIDFFYGYQTDGIFQNEAEIAAYANADGVPIQPDAVPGDFKFVDVNGNGEIDPEDRTNIGDPTPSWTYGFNINLNWRNFDFLFFGQGVAGNQIFKALRRYDIQQANLTGDALERWTGEGSTNDYPRLTFNDTNRNFSRSSDFYIEDGSYFRVKNVQLGYTLPQSLLKTIGLGKVRFYISGNNVLTLTKYTGFDPEIDGGVDRGLYPQPRFFLFGTNVTF